MLSTLILLLATRERVASEAETLVIERPGKTYVAAYDFREHKPKRLWRVKLAEESSIVYDAAFCEETGRVALRWCKRVEDETGHSGVRELAQGIVLLDLKSGTVEWSQAIAPFYGALLWNGPARLCKVVYSLEKGSPDSRAEINFDTDKSWHDLKPGFYDVVVMDAATAEEAAKLIRANNIWPPLDAHLVAEYDAAFIQAGSALLSVDPSTNLLAAYGKIGESQSSSVYVCDPRRGAKPPTKLSLGNQEVQGVLCSRKRVIVTCGKSSDRGQVHVFSDSGDFQYQVNGCQVFPLVKNSRLKLRKAK